MATRSSLGPTPMSVADTAIQPRTNRIVSAPRRARPKTSVRSPIPIIANNAVCLVLEAIPRSGPAKLPPSCHDWRITGPWWHVFQRACRRATLSLRSFSGLCRASSTEPSASTHSVEDSPAQAQRRRDRARRHGCRAVAERHVSRRTGEWAQGIGPHQREDAHELHPDSARRQSADRTHPVRPHPRSDHLPIQVRGSRCIQERPKSPPKYSKGTTHEGSAQRQGHL